MIWLHDTCLVENSRFSFISIEDTVMVLSFNLENQLIQHVLYWKVKWESWRSRKGILFFVWWTVWIKVQQIIVWLVTTTKKEIQQRLSKQRNKIITLHYLSRKIVSNYETGLAHLGHFCIELGKFDHFALLSTIFSSFYAVSFAIPTFHVLVERSLHHNSFVLTNSKLKKKLYLKNEKDIES